MADLLFVPNDEWPAIRKEYLEKNPIKKNKQSVKNADVEEQSSSVLKAKELFGDDLVNIEDD